MVEVFKTNLAGKAQSKELLRFLARQYPSFKMNVDLSDCDRVLRVEGDRINCRSILTIVRSHGIRCEMLP